MTQNATIHRAAGLFDCGADAPGAEVGPAIAGALCARRAVARQRETELTRAAIAAAQSAVEAAERAWGVWADTVRQDVEARHGVPYSDYDALVIGDPEYCQALNVGTELDRVMRAAAGLAAVFERAAL